MKLTFKDYITSSLSETVITKWIDSNIDARETADLLEQHCSHWLKALKNGGLLYRGFKHEQKTAPRFRSLDSTNARRLSRDTDNMYQLLMDHSSALKGIPSRTNSYICTSSDRDAERYGHGGASAYAMIPYNGTIVAQLDVDDIFETVPRCSITNEFTKTIGSSSVSNFFKTLGAAPSSVSSITSDAGVDSDKRQFVDSDEVRRQIKNVYLSTAIVAWDFFMLGRQLKLPNAAPGVRSDYSDVSELSQWQPLNVQHESVGAAIEHVDQYGLQPDDSPELHRAAQLFASHKNDLFDVIASILMTPESMGITAVKFGEALRPMSECWFSGKCVAIRFSEFSELLQYMVDEEGVHITPTIASRWSIK